ncbi:MAG: DUF1109 domain-containing protein [Noviherbaspirillum sp.]
MRTDDLVKMLAARAGPVEERAATRRFAAAMGWGTCGAMLIMAIELGVRPDFYTAMHLPMFWMKIAFPLAGAAAALLLAMRLGRPGMRTGMAPVAIAALLLTVWLAGAAVLLGAPAERRDYLVYGISWKVCPFYIAYISVPLFIAAMWAMKGLAPTRPGLAGAAAGLLAGAMAVAVYALHCPEMEAPFLAIWYVLGMLTPAAAGALTGPFLLRW